jgi:predicted RNA-binding Zn ribbon-like protein
MIRHAAHSRDGRSKDPCRCDENADRAHQERSTEADQLAEQPAEERAGLAAALGQIVGVLAQAAADGTLGRLNVCANDVCRWAHWDGSRNRSGRWCTMAVCGNRIKTRAFRRRSRRPAEPSKRRPASGAR